eukprot:PhM_4_TR18862/c4_g1_i1/m.93436
MGCCESHVGSYENSNSRSARAEMTDIVQPGDGGGGGGGTRTRRRHKNSKKLGKSGDKLSLSASNPSPLSPNTTFRSDEKRTVSFEGDDKHGRSNSNPTNKNNNNSSSNTYTDQHPNSSTGGVNGHSSTSISNEGIEVSETSLPPIPVNSSSSMVATPTASGHNNMSPQALSNRRESAVKDPSGRETIGSTPTLPSRSSTSGGSMSFSTSLQILAMSINLQDQQQQQLTSNVTNGCGDTRNPTTAPRLVEHWLQDVKLPSKAESILNGSINSSAVASAAALTDESPRTTISGAAATTVVQLSDLTDGDGAIALADGAESFVGSVSEGQEIVMCQSSESLSMHHPSSGSMHATTSNQRNKQSNSSRSPSYKSVKRDLVM